MELVALIAEKTSSFGLDVTVDRFDGAHYRIGETFFLRCASEKPGYLYLLYVNDQGEPALLYPLAGEDNRVPGQLAVEIPDPKAGFAFPVQGPAGTARVKALVTSRPLALTGVLQAQQGQTRQKAPSRHEGRRLVQPVGFRWHPAQRRQILRILEQYQRQQPLAAGQLAGVDPKQVLGPFAQDEVALYVEDPNRQRKER